MIDRYNLIPFHKKFLPDGDLSILSSSSIKKDYFGLNIISIS